MRDVNPPADHSGIATAGALVAALLALAAVAYEYSLLKDLRALTDSKAAALAHSQETLRSLDHELQSGARQLAATAQRTREKQAAPNNRQAGAARARPSDRALDKAREDAQLLLASDPSIRATVEKIARIQYQALFGAFIRQQNLTAQQTDQLMNAAVETWVQTLAIGPEGGIHPTQQQPSADVLTSILGADGYQQLLTYQRSLQAVNFTEQVATEAGYASAPLAPAQQDKITDLITGASDTFQSGKPVNLATVDWGAVLTQAGSAGLSPAQADALDRMIVNQQYRAALQQAMQAQSAP